MVFAASTALCVARNALTPSLFVKTSYLLGAGCHDPVATVRYSYSTSTPDESFTVFDVISVAVSRICSKIPAGADFARLSYGINAFSSFPLTTLNRGNTKKWLKWEFRSISTARYPVGRVSVRR
jgi:hypothetical protein